MKTVTKLLKIRARRKRQRKRRAARVERMRQFLSNMEDDDETMPGKRPLFAWVVGNQLWPVEKGK